MGGELESGLEAAMRTDGRMAEGVSCFGAWELLARGEDERSLESISGGDDDGDNVES